MYISPSNPIIKKTLSDFLSKDLEYAEHAYDYDNVIYMVSGVPGAKVVRFSMKCNCADQLFANGAEQMLEEEYKQHLVAKADFDEGFDVTLSIDTSGFPQTNKIKKNDAEEVAEKKREENEQIRAERTGLVEGIADKISKFKRDFLGAPIRQALIKAAAGDSF